MAPKKNGFFCLMEEMMRQNGVKYPTLSHVRVDAAEKWDKMTEKEKQRYHSQAKKGQAAVKYTTSGEKVVDVQKRVKETFDLNQQQIEYISTFISSAAASHSIQDCIFIFAHVNYFFKDNHTFYPAEIAVLGFNFNDGVLPENTFHALTRPVPFPIGFQGEARKNREVHKIDPPSYEATNNMSEVGRDLRAFLKKFMELCSGQKFVIYALEKNQEVVQNVLEMFLQNIPFEVYSLQLLLHHIRSSVMNTDECVPLSVATILLDRDIYSCTDDIACKYHFDIDASGTCSRSLVIGHAYTFCDSCCRYLNIQLIPGKHVSSNSDVTPVNNHSTTEKSSKKHNFEDDYRSVASSARHITNSEFSEDTCSHLSDFIPTKFVCKEDNLCSEISSITIGDSFPTTEDTETDNGFQVQQRKGWMRKPSSRTEYTGSSDVKPSRRPANSSQASNVPKWDRGETTRGRGRGRK